MTAVSPVSFAMAKPSVGAAAWAALLPDHGHAPGAPKVPTLPSVPAAPAPAPGQPATPATPATPPASPVAPAKPEPGATWARPRIEVWGWDPKLGKDVLLQQTGGPASTDPVAAKAFENATKVVDYYHSTFGRSSYDGKGAVVKLRVHAPDPYTGKAPLNNAYWMNDEGRVWLGDGDGVMWSPLGNAVDIVGHELTHGVIDASVQLDTGWGQEAGLQESFADVMATGLDGNWLIGEGSYTPGTKGDGIRDLAHPIYSKFSDLKPWVTEGHELASIPNFAAYKVAGSLGADAMRKIWYEAMTHQLKDHSGFAGAAQATEAAAAKLYGKGSSAYQAVVDAWTAVGVGANTPKNDASQGVRAALALLGTAHKMGAIG